MLRVLVVALSLVVSAHAGAQTQGEARTREIDVFMPHYGYDIAYFAVGASLAFTGTYAMSPRDDDIAPIGAGAHAYHHGPDVASDVTFALVLYGMPLAAYLLDGTRDRDYVRALRVPIVLFESFAMTSGVVGAMKNLGVCRPYAWQADTGACGDGAGVPGDYDEQRRSFPSGHASSTASIAGALMGMWLLPSGRDDRLAPLALGATVLSITTASLRVRAGAHTMTDISAGFGIGFAVGLGTAALHLRWTREDARVQVRLAPMANGLGVSGRF